MKLIENVKGTKGELNIVLRDEAGNVTQNVTVPNLVVNTGLAYIASRMKDTTLAAMTHMAVGSGTTNPAATDTAARGSGQSVVRTITANRDNAAGRDVGR